MKQNIKVAVCTNGKNKTELSEYIPLASYLRDEGVDCVFLLENTLPTNVTSLDLLRQKQFDYYVAGKRSYYPSDVHAEGDSVIATENRVGVKAFIRSRVNKKLYAFLSAFIEPARGFISLVERIRYTKKYLKRVFVEEKFDALLAGGDRALSGVQEAIFTARSLAIPVLTLQIAVDDINFLYTSHRKKTAQYQLDSFLNQLVFRCLPLQTKEFSGHRVVFYPGHIVFALYLFSMLPQRPWHNGDSWSDRYLLISEQDRLDAINSGGKCNNGVVVGQFSHDNLYEVFKVKVILKRRLIKEYFELSDIDREVILVGLPQFYEHNIYDLEKSLCEIEYIMSVLGGEDDKVIFLSLHPKMPLGRYRHIEEKYSNIKILQDERLSEVLPIADYFISTFLSTISWAVMSEVVPIFLDYYDLEFDVEKFNSCQVLKVKQDFKSDLINIFSKKDTIISAIKSDKNYLAPFDGCSRVRIRDAILESASNSEYKWDAK